MHDLKPDWTEACERLRRWWRNEPTDRVVALVEAPRKNALSIDLVDLAPDKYTDPETVFHNLNNRLSSTFYGGEAFPFHWVYLGPVPLSMYIGCEPHFKPRTVWYSRRYCTWDVGVDFQFDRSNRWYRLLRSLTEESIRRSDGQYLVSGQGFGCVADVIANMWGTEETLMAMVERADTVRAVTQKLVDISKALYNELDAIAAPYQDGSIDWIGLWAPGRMWTIQSDLCCMISPAMFEKFFLEELRQEAEYVDYCFYHLDGPDAIKHLDALLGIEALDGIQWVPGAGASTDPLDWIELFLRVQKAGKKLQISCPADRVPELLNKISKQGVCLTISCSDQDCAEEVLRTLDRIGA